MTHEKKKMTRAEAIELIKKHMPDAIGHDQVIDFYIEAGMLEIVEEKKPISVFAEIALKYIKNGKYLEFLSEMDKSGIKMVFKS